jgi:hypothetical protein
MICGAVLLRVSGTDRTNQLINYIVLLRIESPRRRGGGVFLSCSDTPWGPSSLLNNRYRVSFLRLKRPGAWSSPSSTEVKERIELHLYLYVGFPWYVLGYDWPLFYRVEYPRENICIISELSFSCINMYLLLRYVIIGRN